MSYRQVYGDAGLGDLSGTVTSLPAGYTLGEIREEEGGTKRYRLMYNAGGASIPSNSVVARIGSGTLYSVTVTTTSETGATLSAGVTEGAVTVPTDSYFWAGVWGHPFKLISGTISIATGAKVTTAGTNPGYVMVATTPTNNVIAVNIGDFASTVTGIATANTGLAGGRFFIRFEEQSIINLGLAY